MDCVLNKIRDGNWNMHSHKEISFLKYTHTQYSTHTWIQRSTCSHMHAHTCNIAHTHARTSMHTDKHTHKVVHVYACMWTHKCTHICTHICMHTSTCIHTPCHQSWTRLQAACHSHGWSCVYPVLACPMKSAEYPVTAHSTSLKTGTYCTSDTSFFFHIWS